MQLSETQYSCMEVAMALQLDLPLNTHARNQAPVHKAWARSGMSLPYEPGMREHAIAVWLRSLADSMRSQQGMKHSG
jgi:hypothetical protein